MDRGYHVKVLDQWQEEDNFFRLSNQNGTAENNHKSMKSTLKVLFSFDAIVLLGTPKVNQTKELPIDRLRN
ncbi:MAG: hypothetical protein R2941_10985 [Desulfobacterales bacterium]